MSAQEHGIVGRAIFGTGQGLDFQGSGILALGRDTNGIFELDLGRSTEGRASLRALGENGFSMFRRRVAETSERQYELLGWFQVCKDANRRAGFAGACVVVPADRGGAVSYSTAWEGAFNEAQKMMLDVVACIDEETRAFAFPKRPLLERNENDLRITLRLASTATNVLLLDMENEDDSSQYFERFRALCFKIGEETPTIICTKTNISKAIPLSDKSFDPMVSAFREVWGRPKFASIEPRQNNADFAIGSVQSTLNESDSQVDVAGAAALSQQDIANLLDRVTKLEAKHQSLERGLQTLWHRIKRASPPEEKVGWFGGLLERKRLWAKLGLGVGCFFLIFSLVAVIIWFGDYLVRRLP